LTGFYCAARVLSFPGGDPDLQFVLQSESENPIMTTNPPAAYGMYSYDTEFHEVVHTLNQSGFNNEDICMMVSPRHRIATFVRETNILNAERKEGAVAEKLMSWLFEFGAVVIPTVGLFIRSQAFLHALMGNSKSGCLEGLGFSERDAHRFEKQLRERGVLIYVACAKSANAASAVEILRRTGAKEPGLLEQEAFMAAAV
jgi:hypothetical protein